jgi:signal peptidase I
MSWVHRILISLAVLFFAACCGAVLLFNWNALGWKALSVQTGSMRPGLPPGSLVLVHRVPYSQIRVGDVITYANLRQPGTTITHRVIKSFKLDGKVPAFQTKGDANPSADPMTVVGGQVQGKAAWHLPYIGRWLDFSKTWAGLAALVYLPAFFIMFGAAQDMAEYLKKFQVYQLKLGPGGRRRVGSKTAAAGFSVAVFVLIFGVVGGPVQALLRSNTVALVNNRISVAPLPAQCAGHTKSTTVNTGGNTSNSSNSNNVNVNNSSTQTASTGNASNSNNTTGGGNATSGNATNTNCTSTTITITNR